MSSVVITVPADVPDARTSAGTVMNKAKLLQHGFMHMVWHQLKSGHQPYLA